MEIFCALVIFKLAFLESSLSSTPKTTSWLFTEAPPMDLQVDAFLDFNQSNGKSVAFVTDRAYQSGEQVRACIFCICFAVLRLSTVAR